METRCFATLALSLLLAACGAAPSTVVPEDTSSKPALDADVAAQTTVVADANTVTALPDPNTVLAPDPWPANGMVTCNMNNVHVSAQYTVWDTAAPTQAQAKDPNYVATATKRVVSLSVKDFSYSRPNWPWEEDVTATATYDFHAPGTDAGWESSAHIGLASTAFTPEQLNDVGYATSYRTYTVTIDIEKFMLTLTIGGNAGPMSGAVFTSTDCHFQ